MRTVLTVIQNMEQEPTKQFMRFEPIVRAEELTRLKHEIFEGEGVDALAEQPHGIDLAVADIVVFDADDGFTVTKIPWQERKSPDGKAYGVALLEAGREYYLLLRPFLKTTLDQVEYQLRVFPRSSLLRAGVAAAASSFFGGTPYVDERAPLGGLSSE